MEQETDGTSPYDWADVWKLVETYQADVLASLGDRADRADIAHDFWLECGPTLVRQLSSRGVVEHDHTRGFILVALRWYTRDRHRRDSTRRKLLERHAASARLSESAPTTPEQEHDAHAMLKAIEPLSDRERALLDAIVSETSMNELATRHGVSLATMYRRRAALLDMLRERLEV